MSHHIDEVALRAGTLREQAFTLAFTHGHRLGPWHLAEGDEVYIAYCQRCHASAVVDVDHDPRICGQATVRRCAKPVDPFLAQQHESDLTRGAR
jgi:cytochrome c5